MNTLTRDVILETTTVANGATGYTSSLPTKNCSGEVLLEVVVTQGAAASATGTITISQQCSNDGMVWYDPVDSSNSALGVVASALGVSSVYIQATPIVAPYSRYKIVEGGTDDVDVYIRFMYQQDTNRR